jgi:hypothetical protein
MATNVIAALRSCCILEPNASLNNNFDMETNVNNTTEPQHDAKLPVVGSALSPQYCRDCKNNTCDNYEKHLKCKSCVFIGNQQSNFVRKSV